MKPKHIILTVVATLVILFLMSFGFCPDCSRIYPKGNLTFANTACGKCITKREKIVKETLYEINRIMPYISKSDFPDAVGKVVNIPNRDAWEKQFQIKKLGETLHEIRSAGPDGKFGTADDIIQTGDIYW